MPCFNEKQFFRLLIPMKIGSIILSYLSLVGYRIIEEYIKHSLVQV